MRSLLRICGYEKRFLLIPTLIVIVPILLTLNLWSTGAKSRSSTSKVEREQAASFVGTTATSASIITGVAPQTVARSGYITVTGSNFGASQGTSSLLVDSLPAIVVKWSDLEIVGYVPESSHLGNVPVQVTTAGGISNSVNLNVTNRQTNGRIRWQAKVFGDYIDFRAGIAPPGSPDAGSVYANTVEGLTYAWSSSGALKWVVRTGLVGGEGPVTVGQDGTIYVGSLLPDGNMNGPAIIALNPNGTQKWQYIATDSQSVRAGPNVGPDGKIYVIFRPMSSTAPNLVALAPTDGHLVWNYNDNYYKYGHIGKELFFGAQAGLVYFQFESGTFPNGGLYAHRLDNGQRVAAIPGGSDGLVVVAPDQSVHTTLRSYSPLLTTVNWTFPLFGGPTSAPEVGPDNAHYVDQNYYRLYAINSNGTEKWHYDDTNPNNGFGILFDPIVSPSNNLVLMGGRITYGAPGFFNAVNVQNGQRLWKFYLPDEPGYAEYGQVIPMSRSIFSVDGSTAYAAATVAGYNSADKYCFFYAINTTSDVIPINQPPQTTITNPLPNSNVAINTVVNVTAHVQDDGPVDRVEFLYSHNGISTPIGTDTTPDANGDYSASFTASDPGGYGIYATAWDTGGLRGDAPYVSIVVNNEAPHINWVSPANGATFTVPSSITLTAHATDVDGTIASVDFNSSEVGLLGTDTTPDASGNYTIEWANPPVATHDLYAWATDNNGYRIEAVITINVNAVPTPTPTPSPSPTPVGNPPTVSITDPADYTSFPLNTNVTVTANAQDSDGAITRVDFYHAPFDIHLGSDTSAPYTVSVNSASPDLWDIVAVATDNNGNTTTSAPVHVVWEDPNGGLSISGRIRHQQSSPGNEIFLPNAHVRLFLHNGLIRTTLTDAGGNYLFNNLSAGGEYRVQPDEPLYQFFPPWVTFDGLADNETWDFVAAGPLPNPTPTPTPVVNIAWQHTYDGPQHEADLRSRVAVDTQGNTYVVGTSGSATAGDSDISTIKYSPTGQVLWAVPYYGPGNYKDWANDVKVDSQGNVYVTGVAWGGSSSEYDVVTIKYDTGGNQMWARLYNGPIGHWDRGEALDLIKDGNGNVTGVVVSGYSQTSRPNGALYDEFVTIKYDANGIEQWVRRRSTEQISDHAMDVVVDSGGNAYVTGFSLTSPSAGVTTKNFVTVKYSPAGQELWAASFNERDVNPGPPPLPNNPTMDEAGHIALDSSGNVYVAGTNEPSTTGPDYLLLKYNPVTGALVWNRNWSSLSTDNLADMAIDAAGNIYLTGESYDGEYQSATGDETSDMATIKFDGAGSQMWERFYRGFPGKWDGGQKVALDAAGNAYVGLYSEGFFNIDTAVVKYQPDGTEEWVFRYDNPEHSDDDLSDMAVDAGGNIYLAGVAIMTNAAGEQTADLVTAKLVPSSGPINSPPQVTLVVSGPTIAGGPHALNTIVGPSVLLQATADDRDGTVVRVDFYDGANLLGSDTTSPYSFQWDNAPLGTHAIIAAATDNSGAMRSSQTVTVIVTPSLTPPRIIGRVTSNDGTPIDGALINLSGAQTRQTITDANGNYHFDNVAANGSYTVTPSRANYTFNPPSRAFTQVGNQTDAGFTGSYAGDTANPSDTVEYFVRQQYLDFLGREPDEGGFGYWSAQINQCNGNAACIRQRRIDVSAAFFISGEFQQTGSYVYGVYAGTLGRTLNFGEFMSDRSQVLGGAGLDQAKTAFAQAFVQRPEFINRYPQGMTREQFVDAVIQTMTQRSGVDQSSLRAGFLGDYDTGGRALVVRHASEASSFVAAEYNKAFVLMEYFGYLRREIDQGGYDYWLFVLNHGAAGNYRGMVCAFLTSTEYQLRFSTVVTHSNAECGP